MNIYTALIITSQLKLIDAFGAHHPVANAKDPSFDNIVAQKYPTLSSLGPNFVAEYRRNLAVDLTHKSENASAVCDPQCYLEQGNDGKSRWLSCDDLVRHLLVVRIGFYCSDGKFVCACSF